MPERAPEDRVATPLSVLCLLWAVGVLIAYCVLRTQDARPVLLALGNRSLDLAVPFVTIALHIPMGGVILRWIGIPEDRWDRGLAWIGCALGSAILTAIGLGAVGALMPATLLAVPVVTGALAWREWSRARQLAYSLGAGLAQGIRSPAGAVGVLWLGAAALVALQPAASQDALHYHLAVPARWLEAGGFVDVPGNVYSRFPMHTEMLYLTALAWRGPIAAKAFHLVLGVLSAFAVRCLARRYASPGAANWAAIVFLTVPTVFRVTTWAYVEMPIVLFLLLAWQALERPHPLRAAFFIGLACGVKYTMLPVALAFLVVAVLRVPERRLKVAATFFGVSALSGGAWYLRNLWDTGNPLYPFLYSWFGGAGWDGERAAIFQSSLKEWGRLGWDVPFDLTFAARFASVRDFDGVIGPVFLMALPLAILAAWKRPSTRPTLALALGLAVLWGLTTRQIRFLVPCLAVLAALIPVGWECFDRVRWRRVAQCTVALGVLLAFSTVAIVITRESPLAFAVGLESDIQNLNRRLPGGDYELFHRIPEFVPPDGCILFAASGNPVFLCGRPYHADSVVENHTLREILKLGDPDRVAEEFAMRGFTHLVFRFDLVFDLDGKRTDLSLPEQQLLSEFLNRHGRLVHQRSGTFLYAVGGSDR